MSDDLLAEIESLQQEIDGKPEKTEESDKEALKAKQAETKEKAEKAKGKKAVKKPAPKAKKTESKDKPAPSSSFDIESLPKKVQDKARNAIASIENGKPLSRYTLIALEALRDKESIERKALVEIYVEKGLKPNTANSQATQMRKLLPALGIATEDGSKLKANMKSQFLTSIS